MSAAAGTEIAWRARLDTPVRWAGAATGLTVNALVSFSADPDVDLLYGFPVFGLCVMAGVFTADVIARPSPGRLRVAEVTPRRIRDYLPRFLTAALATQAAVLLALLIVATATGSADADGRSGRALSVACPKGTRCSRPGQAPTTPGQPSAVSRSEPLPAHCFCVVSPRGPGATINAARASGQRSAHGECW